MGKIAFLFAGQGAQYTCMGHSLYELGGAAAKVFDTAEAQRPGTKADCFEGSAERLKETVVTQPCVFCVDLAAAAALKERGVTPHGVAGFSLGEMAALTFAGAFSTEEGFRLVCRRGEVMDEAARENPGVMAAVLRLGDEKVEELCGPFEKMYPVNYNCEGQLVVAGDAGEMEAFMAAVKGAGGMARPLAVSGAFHSPFMEEASKKFYALLLENGMQKPEVPVFSNLSAQPYVKPLEEKLAAQMQYPVRWKKTLEKMAAEGYDTFVEVGPGKTLTGLAKRIVPGAALHNVQDAESLEATLAALQSTV